jgi:hypothetical protein
MTDSAPTNVATKDDLDQLRGDLTKLMSALAVVVERTEADVKYIAERVKPNRYDFVLEWTELEKRLDARLNLAVSKLAELLRKKSEDNYDGAVDTGTVALDVVEIGVALRRRDWRVEMIEERLASVERRLGIETA